MAACELPIAGLVRRLTCGCPVLRSRNSLAKTAYLPRFQSICASTLQHRPSYRDSESKTQKRASSTQRTSQAVPHPSTDRALQRLASEFGRDPVYSLRYGRLRTSYCRTCAATDLRVSSPSLAKFARENRLPTAVSIHLCIHIATPTKLPRFRKQNTKKSKQHPKDFPGGPPPQY